MKKAIKIISMALIVLLLSPGVPFSYAAAEDFSDVPKDHWAYDYINELRELGVTDGIGDNAFGLGREISRAEFAAFMCKLMGWEITGSADGSFEDNKDPANWYFGFIEAAVKNGAIIANSPDFYPDEPITRGDMAVMVTRTLGYDALANKLGYLGKPFPDVQSDIGYITIAKDLGVVNGISDSEFAPGETALREQAAAMLIRMHTILENKTVFSNAFYAIGSYSQMSAIDRLDSVCFGWSRLELDGGSLTLNTTVANGNEYNFPNGYQEPLARADGKDKILMVAVKEADSPVIINDDALRADAVDVISQAMTSGSGAMFDGVAIDFETLRGQQTREAFNSFLSRLRASMPDKKLYVMVQPARRAGIAYYDGYDFKTIGEIADKVILMAHDYYPKSLTDAEMASGAAATPLAPLDEVYYAIKAICDPVSGVSDRGKVLLQIAFDSVQWKTADGKTVNRTPYRPSYSAIAQRIQSGAAMGYDDATQSPYISFFSDDDQTNNIVWYEDTRSVAAKIRLAELFGLGGISYWRLGIIPDFSSEMFLNVL